MSIAFFWVVTRRVVVIIPQKNAVLICKQQLQKSPGIRWHNLREFAGRIYRNFCVREIAKSVDKEMYTDIFHRLRDAVRSKRPENWRTNCWLFHHDNATTHRSIVVNDFWAKFNVQCDNNGAFPAPGSSWFLPVPSTETSIEGMALLWFYRHN